MGEAQERERQEQERMRSWGCLSTLLEAQLSEDDPLLWSYSADGYGDRAPYVALYDNFSEPSKKALADLGFASEAEWMNHPQSGYLRRLKYLHGKRAKQQFEKTYFGKAFSSEKLGADDRSLLNCFLFGWQRYPDV